MAGPLTIPAIFALYKAGRVGLRAAQSYLRKAGASKNQMKQLRDTDTVEDLPSSVNRWAKDFKPPSSKVPPLKRDIEQIQKVKGSLGKNYEKDLGTAVRQGRVVLTSKGWQKKKHGGLVSSKRRNKRNSKAVAGPYS